MIDEIAEVKNYMAGEPPEDRQQMYRACYMIAKYMKEDGKSPVDTVSFLNEWSGRSTRGVNLLQCVNAAYTNENKLRRGGQVYISDADVEAIIEHSPTETDRKVALALLCNAKAFADRRGVFQASTEGLASWLGMKGPNVRGRNLRRLVEWRYIDKIDTGKGKTSGRFTKYSRGVSCFKILVPYENTGKYALKDNDINSLYHAIFKAQ